MSKTNSCYLCRAVAVGILFVIVLTVLYDCPASFAQTTVRRSGASVRDAAGFVHPGGWQAEADLERIRSEVTADAQPWAGAWAAMKNSDADIHYQAHPTAQVTDAYLLQNDGHAAYTLAIKWAASGDPAYAAAAENIIDTWTSTVQSAPDTTMRNGLGSNQMANAAEILAYGFHGSAGWPPANIQRAKEWFKNVVYPRIENGAAANWGTSCIAGMISMSVFCDDREMFDRAVDAYKHGFMVDGSSKGGCAGVTQYIDATGEDAESGRDQGHSQGGIAHLLEAALVAWNQGINLVSYNDSDGVLNYGQSGANRLFTGLEYTAKYNLGNDVGYHPYFEYCNDVFIYPAGISDKGRGNFSPVWEMANYLFNKVGLNPVFCKQVIASPGYQPERTNSDHPGMGTLLFSQSSER